MQILRMSFFIITLGAPGLCFGLEPIPEFAPKDTIGNITTYESKKSSNIHISKMKSDFAFDDLTQKNVDDLSELYAVKNEYGKMAGFKDWKAVEKKFINEKNHRMLVLSGHYTNTQNKKINFLEVYWAEPKQSKQYLITSESKDLKADEYKAYLK